jgi:hypothetical protein
MHFSFVVNEPSEIVNKAKAMFAEQYGPDLVVRSCNLQGRKEGLLYCVPGASVRNVVPIKDIGNIVKPLPTRPH